ncbi:MAG: hypothetical protein JNK53_00480 [Phycisphaerae bacterium]|nr:hypothetical protein [Phycisphaerae bacterium]
MSTATAAFKPFHRVVACLVLAVLAGAGLSTGLQDNFRGSTPAPWWFVVEDGATVRQGNGNLSFSVPPGAVGRQFAGYLNGGYTLDFASAWNTSIRYSLRQYSPVVGATYGAVTLFGFSNERDEQIVVAPYVYRTVRGAFLGLVRIDQSGLALQEIGAIPPAGSLEVAYTPAGDRLQVSINGTVRWTGRSFTRGMPGYGLNIWGIGAVGWHGARENPFRDGIAISQFKAGGPGLVPLTP